MSIINPDRVSEGLIEVIRGQIGSLLADMPSEDPENPLKAVIKDIQGGIRPDYPYIVVSVEDSSKDGWLRHVAAGSDDETHILTEQDLLLRITCYGDESTNILNTLRIISNDSWSRVDMNRETSTTFVGYSDIYREPVYLETDFVNTAYMFINLTAVSDYTTSAGLIETVTGEGTYPRFEGDELPIVDTFNVSS